MASVGSEVESYVGAAAAKTRIYASIEHIQESPRIFLLWPSYALGGRQELHAPAGAGDGALRIRRNLEFAVELLRLAS